MVLFHLLHLNLIHKLMVDIGQTECTVHLFTLLLIAFLIEDCFAYPILAVPVMMAAIVGFRFSAGTG